MEIKGAKRKVLMQAPKNGFFYVLDRTNGKFISGDPFVYTNWAKKLDSITGRPIEEPGVHYETVNTDVSPNYNGGHNWQPMAYNPNLNLVYIPARENVSNYGHDTTWKYNHNYRDWETTTSVFLFLCPSVSLCLCLSFPLSLCLSVSLYLCVFPSHDSGGSYNS